MNVNTISTSSINAQIAKGTFRPHTALSNMGLNFFLNSQDYFARSIFPICRVRRSADNYHRFGLEDLLRSGWAAKPALGKVMPTVFGEDTDTYAVKVYQMIMGIDEIDETDISRREGPSYANDTRQINTKIIAEHANILQDEMFANSFFRAGVWSNEVTGVDGTTPNADETIKWTNDNSDPVQYVSELKLDMKRKTGREPNRMALGAEVFTALRKHPAILERVKYGGSTPNPAKVTKNVLAQLFEMDDLSVMMSIHNQAKVGKDADMKFIADPTAMLLAYATSTPSIKEPSAGYIFQWDMLGDGQIMPIFHYPGEGGTHSEYVEGLMAFQMKKTADDLAVFVKDLV